MTIHNERVYRNLLLSLFSLRRDRNKLREVQKQIECEGMNSLLMELEKFANELEKKIMEMDLSSITEQFVLTQEQVSQLLEQLKTADKVQVNCELSLVIEHLKNIQNNLLAIE